MASKTISNQGQARKPSGHHGRRRIEPWILAALFGMLPSAHGATPETGITENDSETPSFFLPRREEAWNSGWAFSFDNDLFAGSGDSDYTGGVALTLSGRRAQHLPLSIDPALRWLDYRTGFARLYTPTAGAQYHAMQFGVLLFTPRDIVTREPIFDDRPYANLVYLANTQYVVSFDESTAYQSTLTVGLLGTGIGETLQNAVHSVTGSDKAQGYRNQISNGGEPTFRYAVAQHSLLSSGFGRRSHDLKLSVEGSVGYLTEASVGLGVRWGRIATPWWVSTSDYGDYAAQPFRQTERRHIGRGSRERYVSTGIKLRARAYNAFLQGQFRDSAVTLGSSDINNLLMESWVGYTTTFGQRRVSYVLRFQTAELRDGAGARNLAWAGVNVST